MKRSPLKRGSKPLGRGKPVSAVSSKRRSEQAQRAAVREAVILRDRGCRGVGVIPGHVCGRVDGRPRLEVHEIIPRSAWPAGYLVESNCISLCPVGHDWVGLHPSDAHELGLHGYSWERPT